MRYRPRPLGLAATCLVLVAGCSTDTRSPAAGRPNLLLVTLDTVRADRLGCYDYAGAETPTIDRLAREGALAPSAFAVVPLTLPSHASILTGLYPPRHGIRDNADFRLPGSVTTIAEHLRGLGYRTAASVGSLILAKDLGLDQGFESYAEPALPPAASPDAGAVRFARIVERRASAVTDDALAALARFGDDPFFLWVHYYDPHNEYEPPEPYATRFADRPYDGEIAYTDVQLGRLIDAVRAGDSLDRTLVVVTADHGESLGEHGETTHGLFVYDATIRVPLVVRLPGTVPAGTRPDALISSVDLVPTILDLMGLPAMDGTHGVDCAAALRGGTPAEREPVYAESIYPERAYGWAPLLALRGRATKFIEAPEPELYDLRSDPGETRNLAADDPALLGDWRRRLVASLDGFGRADPDAEATMTAEQRANLESLGYVAGAAAGATRSTRPDPKRLVQAHNTLLAAKLLTATDRHAEVARMAEEVLAIDPENPAALALRGTVLFATGGRGEGLEALAAAARAAPSVFENQWNFANALHLAGRHREAVDAYRAAIAIQPASGLARHGLGNALYALGDARGAVEAYGEAARRGAATPALRASLGAALADIGDVTAAERELSAAVAADASLAQAWNKLGVLADKSGRRGDAITFFTSALDAEPRLADGLFNRGKLLLLLDRPAEAERDAARLVELHPDYAAGWFLKANVLAARGDRAGARAALRRCLAAPGLDPRLADSARTLLGRLEG